jgi:Domain of unknown function (DUF4118)
MANRLSHQVDGEGAAWGAGAFVASLLVGVAIEPFRRTIGLENVVMVYLLMVVLAAAVGGRTAGLVAAVSAALSYDFFLTSPYHSLAIDSAAQVITVALLLATGLVASLAGRARRRLSLAADEQAALLQLLNAVAATATAGGDTDRVAVDGIRQLLDANRVTIRRAGPDGETVVDAGEPDTPLDDGDLLHLDEQGRITRPAPATGAGVVRWVPRGRGAELDLVHHHRPVGTLVVVLGAPYPLSRVTRLALATIAHTLAAVGAPERPPPRAMSEQPTGTTATQSPLEQRHAERAGELQAWVDRVADPGERPLAVFAWLADWYARDGARGCAFLNAAAELPDPAGPARLAIGREKRWLADLLARLVHEAGLPDPDRLASQLLLLIDGVAARVLVHGAGAAAQAVADASAVAVLLVSTAARAAS